MAGTFPGGRCEMLEKSAAHRCGVFKPTVFHLFAVSERHLGFPPLVSVIRLENSLGKCTSLVIAAKRVIK